MQENTRQIIILSVEADATIPAYQKTLLLNFLDGKTPQTESEKPKDRIISRSDVASILGCSVQMVDYYARNGYIARVSITGKQSQGYLESSIYEALRRGSRSATRWRKQASERWTPEKRAERSQQMKEGCRCKEGKGNE